uniref:Uncharacterized protein n=1 Tax=Megaselia scalaris TaxID=36166 RepID=T1GSG0_MEGSC
METTIELRRYHHVNPLSVQDSIKITVQEYSKRLTWCALTQDLEKERSTRILAQNVIVNGMTIATWNVITLNRVELNKT